MFALYDSLKQTLYLIETKLNENEKQLSLLNPSIEIKKITTLEKTIASLKQCSKLHKRVKTNINNYHQAHQIFKSEDGDLHEIAKQEMETLASIIDKQLKELQLLLLPKDLRDNKNVIMEIRGAAGGDEANIFASDLYRMYVKYFEIKKNFSIELIQSSPALGGGFSLISFMVKGSNAYSLLKWESGAHRVQRVPKTETKGRIHTSTATVLVMAQVDDIDFEIKKEDLRIDTFRSSGAGGQHVNTTDSAVRITHLPTGVVAQSQDGRSQHKNKEIAMTILKARIFDHLQETKNKERHQEAKSKIGSGDRSEKIRTYNYPQNRVTDHRINLTINKLNDFMEGKIEKILNALITHEQNQKILEFSFK